MKLVPLSNLWPNVSDALTRYLVITWTIATDSYMMYNLYGWPWVRGYDKAVFFVISSVTQSDNLPYISSIPPQWKKSLDSYFLIREQSFLHTYETTSNYETHRVSITSCTMRVFLTQLPYKWRAYLRKKRSDNQTPDSGYWVFCPSYDQLHDTLWRISGWSDESIYFSFENTISFVEHLFLFRSIMGTPP